jgi:hypothetical protein
MKVTTVKAWQPVDLSLGAVRRTNVNCPVRSPLVWCMRLPPYVVFLRTHQDQMEEASRRDNIRYRREEVLRQQYESQGMDRSEIWRRLDKELGEYLL